MTLDNTAENTLDSAKTLDDMANLLVEEDDLPNNVENEPNLESESQDAEPQDLEDNVTWGKALGLDDNSVVLDDDGNLKGVKVKIDGKEDTVELKELIAGYQYNKFNTQKGQALSEESKAFKAKVEQESKAYADKLDSLEKATAYVKNQFLKQFENIDWQKLRYENPAEYSALVQDFQMQNTEFDRIITVIDDTKQSEISRLNNELSENIARHQKEQLALSLSKNPEWNNPKVLKTALEDMNSFMGETYGFTPQEFASINDHRMIEVIKDAMKFRRGIKEAEQKIIQQKPNFQKQTGVRKNNVSHLDKLIKRAATATGTAKRGAETDAIAQLLIDTGVKT